MIGYGVHFHSPGRYRHLPVLVANQVGSRNVVIATGRCDAILARKVHHEFVTKLFHFKLPERKPEFMHNECDVAVFTTAEQARDAAHRLNESAFPTNQVSLVISSLNDMPEVAADLEIGEDALRNAINGAGLGSLVVVLGGAAVTVFGGGIFLTFGAVSGLLSGGIMGSLLAAMDGWGVHGERITHYESLGDSGHPLIVAHGNPVQIEQAYHLLQKTDAKEVHRYADSDDGVSPAVGKRA